MILAIIPARGGSKGVPGKNTRHLAGYPLIAYSIAAAKLSRRVARVVVSTDSEDIAAISRAYGAEVPFLRPGKLAGDNSPDREFVLHMLDWLKEHEGSQPQYLVHLRPTTPLRNPVLVDEAIDICMADLEATSLRSAHLAPESPLKWFTRNERGYFQNFVVGLPAGYVNLPRQHFPAVYVPDGYVDVLKTAYVLNAEDLHGPHLLGYVSPVCQEVDTSEAFDWLEYEIMRNGSPVLDFLRSHFAPQPTHG